MLSIKEDYGVISRVAHPPKGKITIIVLTDSNYKESITKVAPSGWQQKNLQVVLGTEVIDNNSGPPRIVAAAFR